jgi:hypothetical protein
MCTTIASALSPLEFFTLYVIFSGIDDHAVNVDAEPLTERG